MLKEAIFIVALAALASNYGALAEDENPASVENEPSLGLQTRRNRRKIPTNYCIKYLYVMVHTSASVYAETLGEHQVVLKADGEARAVNLTTPLGGILQGKGDLWKLSLKYDFGFTGCVTVKDIENMVLQENDSDGWKIDSIVTFLVVNPYYWTMSSADFDVNVWIDGDTIFTRQFILTLRV